MKKPLVICVIILCILMCSCNQSTMPETTLNSNTPDASPTVSETPNIDDYDITVLNQSGFGGEPTNGSIHFEDLEKLGILYPPMEFQVEDTWKDKVYEITICGNTYKAPYNETSYFTEDVSNEFLKGEERHYFESKTPDGVSDCYIKISKKTGKLHFLHLFDNSPQLKNSTALMPYYSGEYIKEKMPEILVDIYGEEILEYLDTYYTFEYAKKDKDFAGEGYKVLYRAYIDGIPTDDTLTVWLTLDRKLWSVSAPNYLQYLNIKPNIPVKIMDLAMDEYIKTNFDHYSKIEPDTESSEPHKYFIMNSRGELYYQTRWLGFKEHEDLKDLGLVDYLEVLLIKAT